MGIFYYTFFVILITFQLNVCDNSDNGEENGADGNGANNNNSNGGETNFFEETATLTGSLPAQEVANLMPPSTPLPDDITIESIITRSDLIGRNDILGRSDFIYKWDVAQSSSTGINEDETFTLSVPVGYEFITLVRAEGDVVGLVKFEKDEKYVSNITIPPSETSNQKRLKFEGGSTYDIGVISGNDDYFVAETSIFDISTAESEEELSLSSDADTTQEIKKIKQTVNSAREFSISVASEEVVTFDILNMPAFCTFTDNGDNSAILSCSPVKNETQNDEGKYNGIYLWAATSEKNGHIELALEVVSESTPQIAAGLQHTCYLSREGKVKCWGDNSFGQLGSDNYTNIGDEEGEMGTNLSYINFETGEIVRNICAGSEYTCFILDDGSVKCAGRARCGDIVQLEEFNLGSDNKVKSIACGSSHTCVILDDGSVKCWGSNDYGGLGYGDKNSICNAYQMGDNLKNVDLGAGNSALTISVGVYFTCAIIDDGDVKCWGNNDYGQLGQGDTLDRGDDENEMGDSLPSVSLGTGRRALSISSGYSHVCAILDNNTLKCWGSNTLFQLGYTGGARGNESNEMGDNLPIVDLVTPEYIFSGSEQTCAIISGNYLKCWGISYLEKEGIITQFYPEDYNYKVDTLLPINLGTGRTVVNLAVGYEHICAILDDSSIKCWGKNDYGQLGYGDTISRGYSTGELGDNLPVLDLGL